MKIDVNLYATLSSKLPEGCTGNSCILELSDDVCVKDVLDLLRIAPDEPKILLLNGVHAKLGQKLEEGDRLAVFPPIAGG